MKLSCLLAKDILTFKFLLHLPLLLFLSLDEPLHLILIVDLWSVQWAPHYRGNRKPSFALDSYTSISAGVPVTLHWTGLRWDIG